MSQWSIEAVTRESHILKTTERKLALLLTADQHWDNPKCNQKLFKRHLEQAKDVGAAVCIFGDFFCCMQGNYDKRASKQDIRPEHQTGNYFDSLVDTAVEWLLPYKDNLALISLGNHETSIRKHHETDLIDRLCSHLRAHGSQVCAGDYKGWLSVRLRSDRQFNFWYHHGHGGGGPVTKGLIDFNRYGTYIEADALVCGHVHHKNYDRAEKAIYNPRTNIEERKPFWCVRVGTYKDEYFESSSGFHVEKGRGPRPLGGWWCNLNIRKSLNKDIVHPTFWEAD